MKASLVQLSNAEAAMHMLSQKTLPFDVAYQVSKLVRKAKGPIEDYRKAEMALIEAYGTPAVEGQRGPGAQYNLDLARIDEFNEKLKTLRDTEEELNVKPINVSQLSKLDIEPGVLTPLFDWFLIDDLPE